MSIKYVEGDLFQHVPDDSLQTIVLTHVCNDKGAMGSGFVIPLAKHYPRAKESYLEWAHSNEPEMPFQQGEVQFVEVRKDPLPLIFVANMVAQTLGGPHPLSYDSLEKCMEKVANFAERFQARIVAPLFGSGLAGGSWPKIEHMICQQWIPRGIPVTVYYLPQFLPQDWNPPTE